MVFHSITYAVFLPIVFLLYWTVLKKSVKGQNLFLLMASYLFYGWWDARFLSLIVLSSLVDFFASLWMSKTEDKTKRAALLCLSLFMNLGFLFYFKYTNFFIDTLNILAGKQVYNFMDILLPLGISFYTFQTLSYTIDVYRRKLEPTNDLLAFCVYVSFFPQIVAGPIERALDLLPQFFKTRSVTNQELKEGLRLILWGIFKKVAVADLLAKHVDIVYKYPQYFDGISVYLACVFFTFQIYCDFSGYSDIAIGSGKLLGFKLTKNFDTPFFSRSMVEFRRRWHITLSQWLRDYLYIPLGGNRVSEFRKYLNIIIVFLVSGFWHGAAWKFILWGAYHGSLLVFETFTKSISLSVINATFLKNTPRLLRVMQTVKVFTLFAFALILFRADNMSDVGAVLSSIIGGIGNQLQHPELFHSEITNMFITYKELWLCVITIVVFCIMEFTWREEGMEKAFNGYSKPLRWTLYYAMIAWICFFGEIEDSSSFVYFQF